MSQSATAVLATEVVVVAALRKRKAPKNPPFQWVSVPGLKLAYAELVRDKADRLLDHTAASNAVYEKMGQLLEARFNCPAMVGPEGLQRLKQEYRNFRSLCGAFVKKHSISGNGRLATIHSLHPNNVLVVVY